MSDKHLKYVEVPEWKKDYIYALVEAYEGWHSGLPLQEWDFKQRDEDWGAWVAENGSAIDEIIDFVALVDDDSGYFEYLLERAREYTTWLDKERKRKDLKTSPIANI